MPGRNPKPIEQLKRQGTYRPDRHGPGKFESPPAELEPVARPTLQGRAAEVYDQILGQGAAWLGRTDAIRLVMLRDSLAERERLLTIAEDSLEARRELRALNKEISEWLSALGFDPASRARLGLAEVKTRSKLQELLDAQARRSS